MAILYLRAIPEGIEITTILEPTGETVPRIFCEVIRPGEPFGGFSYVELQEIARTRGQMDADELKG
jgi:hypothetical protein